MEKAHSSVKPDDSSIRRRNEKAINKKTSRIDKLVKLYKQLRAAIKKLEGREISFGDDYDEQFEDTCNRRLMKLTQKHLRIHRYLVRRGIFVSETGAAIAPDVKPKLIVTSTGNEDLNQLLTEYVNQESESEVFGSKVRLPYRHVTVNDVKMLVNKLKETKKTQPLQDNSLESDQLIQNIACEVNKLVKRCIEDNHRVGLDDWIVREKVSEYGDFPSTSISESKEDLLSVPTWDVANVELHKACGRGELDCPEAENSGDVDDTEMSPTADEIEDEEGCAGDIDDNVNEAMANESDDSCCIIEERIHEKSERSTDSDCWIIESTKKEISEEIVNEDIENMEASPVSSAEKPSKNVKSNGEMVDDDDDCCIIKDW